MAAVSATLLDLDNKCLQQILDPLDQCDLTNLAEAFNITAENVEKLEKSDDDTENLIKSKYVRFAKAVRKMFAQKFSKVWINRDLYGYEQYLKLLHRFGDLIRHLLINNWSRRSQPKWLESSMEEIGQAVLKHCRESLVSIQLASMDKEFFSTICEPFTNVESLELLRDIPDSFLQLNKWFPNLRTLKLNFMVVAQPECIECYFPKLEKLSISNGTCCYPVFSNSNLAIALRLNNQLKSLKLRDDEEPDVQHPGICLNQQFIHSINRKLPNLSHLTVNIDQSRVSDLPFEGWIEMKCLSSLTVRCLDWCQLKYNVPIKSNQLKKVYIESRLWNSNEREDFEYLINFAKNNNNIGELKIEFVMEKYCNDFYRDEHGYDSLGEFWVDLINALPKLEIISIPHDWQNNSAEVIFHMLRNNKNIFQFTCKQFSTQTDDNEIHDFDFKKQKFEERFHQYAEIYDFDTSSWNVKFIKEYYEEVILSKITVAPESSCA